MEGYYTQQQGKSMQQPSTGYSPVASDIPGSNVDVGGSQGVGEGVYPHGSSYSGSESSVGTGTGTGSEAMGMGPGTVTGPGTGTGSAKFHGARPMSASKAAKKAAKASEHATKAQQALVKMKDPSAPLTERAKATGKYATHKAKEQAAKLNPSKE